MLQTIRYGAFTWDGRAVCGPKDYMDARGVALLDAILAGEDEGFSAFGFVEEEDAVLARLDEDYQAWHAGR